MAATCTILCTHFSGFLGPSAIFYSQCGVSGCRGDDWHEHTLEKYGGVCCVRQCAQFLPAQWWWAGVQSPGEIQQVKITGGCYKNKNEGKGQLHFLNYLSINLPSPPCQCSPSQDVVMYFNGSICTCSACKYGGFCESTVYVFRQNPKSTKI